MKTAIGMAVLMMTELALANDIGALMDPTRPFSAEAGIMASGGLVLQSVLISPARKLAIINGRTLGLGAKVGKSVVADIRPNEVVLWDGRRETHLRLVPALKTEKDASNARR